MDGAFPLAIDFFFNDTATTEIYTLSLHDALPIYERYLQSKKCVRSMFDHLCALNAGDDLLRLTVSEQIITSVKSRSEEHTSELQSPDHLVCRLLLEKKKSTPTHTAGSRLCCWCCS